MRFILIIKSDAKAEAGEMPDEQLLSAMGKYNEALMQAGVLLSGEGLKASSLGKRIVLAGGKATLSDGPFAEAKELVAGFWVISVKSKAEAIEWAKRVPGKEGEIEVRQLFEAEDFAVDPAEQPGGWRDQELAQREAAAQAPAAPPRKPGTTRFMVMLKADKFTETPGAMPSEKLLTEMGALMQGVAERGDLLAGDGLQPTAKGARVVFAGDKRSVIDGPFSEAKELVAGFTIIQLKTMQEAVDFARRQLQIHVEGAGLPSGTIDVRPIFDMDDFAVSPAEKPDGWRQKEQAFRERTGQT